MVSLLIPSPITKTKQKEPIENSIHQTPPTKSLHGSKSLLARITHEGYFNTPGLLFYFIFSLYQKKKKKKKNWVQNSYKLLFLEN